MKDFFIIDKKILAGVMIAILAVQFRFAYTISSSVYEIQKKSICKKIFSSISDSEFFRKEFEFGEVFYTKTDSDYVNMTGGMIDIYYPIISKEFNCFNNEKVIVVIYPSKKMIGEVLQMGIEEVPMGAYYGGIINVLSPTLWTSKTEENRIIDEFLEEGPMVHELIHLALDKKLKGNYEIWFTEGIALYYEKKYTGFVWRDDLKEKCKYITIEDLKNNFRFLKEEEAYRRSFDIIQSMVNKIGEEGLQDIIKKMSRGEKLENLYNIG